MKLWQKQALFSVNLSLLIQKIMQEGKFCSIGEVYRTKEQAQWYAEKGLGIKNSLHCKKLAVDINLFDAKGNYLTQLEDYEIFGEYWCDLHVDNIWGGSFLRRDMGHFEFNG